MAGTAALRPISLVEILDRAIDLSVRKLPMLTTVLLVSGIPSLVLIVRNGGQIFVYTEIAHRLGLTATAPMSDIAHSTLALIVAVLLEFVVGPLVGTALFVSISSFYLTGRSSIVEDYRAVGSIAVSILCLNILCGVPTFAVFVANDEALRRFPITQPIPHLAVIFVGIFAMSSIGFAGNLAGCAVTFERLDAGRALWKAFRQLSAPRRFFRTFGALMLAFASNTVTAVAHDTVWSFLPMNHVTNTFVVAFIAALPDLINALLYSAFVIIFYYDIRVREEGFDLRVALDAIGQAITPVHGTRFS